MSTSKSEMNSVTESGGENRKWPYEPGTLQEIARNVSRNLGIFIIFITA